MKKLSGISFSALARIGMGSIAIVLSMSAFAQEKACVMLKTEGQKEELYTDAQGKPAKRLVPPGKVLPGDEIIWTITATNSCNKPADRVVVNNNVPEHMTYVADSAMGVGTGITYSLDGRDYRKPGELKVREADGTTHPARPDEIKSIRWTFDNSFAANAVGFVRYRAKVQ